MNKSRVRVTGFFLVAFLFVTLLFPSARPSAKIILDKKTQKAYKLIETREALLDEFKSHVFALDESFKIYVSNKVVKNFQKEFKGIWNDLVKDQEFNEIWKHNKEYKSQLKNYTKSKAKCWEWNVKKLTFDITKEEVDDLRKSFKNVIQSKEQLVKEYSSRILNMDENFTLYISKKAIKNFGSEFNDITKKLGKNKEYVNLMDYAKVISSNPYEQKDLWKWSVKVEYYASDETAKEVKKGSKKVIKTAEDLEKAMILYTHRLDKKIILDVDKKALDFTNEIEYNKFWMKLYRNPNFVDVFAYVKNFRHKLINHKNHTEWVMDMDYKIAKKDVKSLDDFVSSTGKNLFSGKKTAEAKVRAIHDFMTKNYKLDYGPKGKKWYFTDLNSAKAVRGNFSVNTSHALYKEKKGTSDAFANLFFKLAKTAKLDVKVVLGKKDKNRYAWNMVKVDGNWYHISTARGEKEKDTAYLKSDKTMKKAYSWEAKEYPKAKKDF